ncbi:hypothetical protein HMPREF9701_02429 [Delftia acidovorans CCUG 274B]|jgi:hypothetical protein|uniref:Uncharacterized protein n=1 Tax=Delftia lacustris TaxID=558537 RepID=A0A1H3HSI1_9BURK|nr:hypothetical protein HMPREF9702_05378 [Delftia acidovorans CCUG 15835]EPD40182.1 hypothetical protein HMPREF9701_02429 [Delftia acidovorans CCUG 274B]MBS3721597.1 hypothetical protein [Delftia sp. PE138]MDR6729576.1 hypothetical protein [Delftia lacustris]SFB65395.1 hypothetical protein SAMN05444579_12326 [Delftia tsuruhatensis]
MPTPLRSFSADASFGNWLTETLARMVDGGTG